jgi:hypothetical protein
MRFPVANLIIQLVEQHIDIEAINLFRPKLSPPIQDNPALSENERQLVIDALGLRGDTAFPFWDCLLQIIANSSSEAAQLLVLAQRHNPQSHSMQTLPREHVKSHVFEALMSNLAEGEMLAVSSRTECSGGKVMHVPMLDFHCKISSINDRRVKTIAQRLDLHGYIVHSGQSYHFYGCDLLDSDSLMAMLAQALLFTPFVDRAWVAHQLIEKACGLRISPGKTYLRPPIVVDQV